MGRIRKSILHYSFSAIYDKYKEEANHYLDYQLQVKEEENEDSGFGIVISQPTAKQETQEVDTLVMVEKVAEFGANMLGLPNNSR
jgi:hypothetical protein